MKKSKIMKTVIRVIITLIAVAEGIAVTHITFQNPDMDFSSRVLLAGIAVLFPVVITILLGHVLEHMITQQIALEESGLQKNQVVYVIDYAHNEVMRIKVTDVFFWNSSIAVTGTNCGDGHSVCYIDIHDVFTSEDDAVEENKSFVESQLERVEEYFGITISESGAAYFKKAFATLYPRFMIFTHHYEWDVEWFESSLSSKIKEHETCKEYISEKGYSVV